MGQLLLLIMIFIVGLSLFFAPWIAGLAYVFNSLLQPQFIWPWVFEGISIFRITAVFAILGFVVALAQKKISFETYKNNQNLMIVFIWVWMHLSHIFSSYKGFNASVSPETVLSTLDSILIMYFILLPLLNSEKTLRYSCYALILAGGFYIYWANMAYFNEEWGRFIDDRLTGPDGSPYRDANVLSTLIVMCLPFIILLFFRVKNLILKTLIVMSIPFAWHAIILFSSRAALLASIISLLLIAFVIKSKKANIVIAISFVVFMAYQGNSIVDRAADTISESRMALEKPINPRVVSWEAGLRLIPKYPIFGAGVQMFEAAADRHFPGMTPHVAHNTFINFSANAGVLTGAMFLGLIYMAWRRLRVGLEFKNSFSNTYYYAAVASSISIVGFFVCSIFLDLIIYEPFYFVLIINLISWEKLRKTSEDRSSSLSENI